MRSFLLSTLIASTIILNSNGQTLRGARMAQEFDTSPGAVAGKVAEQVDVDAVRGNVEAALGEVDVTDAVDAVKDIDANDVVGNITDAVKEINATDVVSNVTDAVEDAVDTIKEVNKTEVLDNVSENVDIDAVQEVVGSAVENVAENVAENVDVDKVTEIAGSVATGLNDADLTGTVEGIRDGDVTPEEAADAAAEVLESVAGSVAENIDVETVSATATEVLGSAQETATEALGNAQEAIGNVAGNTDVDGADVINTADCILDCGNSCEAAGGNFLTKLRCNQNCVIGCAP